jgi:hypothetical protein
MLFSCGERSRCFRPFRIKGGRTKTSGTTINDPAPQLSNDRFGTGDMETIQADAGDVLIFRGEGCRKRVWMYLDPRPSRPFRVDDVNSRFRVPLSRSVVEGHDLVVDVANGDHFSVTR